MTDCSDLSPEEHKTLQQLSKACSGTAQFVRKSTGYLRMWDVQALEETGYIERVAVAHRTMIRVVHKCNCRKNALPDLRPMKLGASIPALAGVHTKPIDIEAPDLSNMAGANRYDKPANSRFSSIRLARYFKHLAQAANSVTWAQRELSPKGETALKAQFKRWFQVGATEDEIAEIVNLFFREVRHTPPDKELWRAFIARREYWARNIGKKEAPGDDATEAEQAAYWLGEHAEAILRRNAGEGTGTGS